MENNNQIIFGLIGNTENMNEQNKIIQYLNGKKPKDFITVSEITNIYSQCDCLIVSSIKDAGKNSG